MDEKIKKQEEKEQSAECSTITAPWRHQLFFKKEKIPTVNEMIELAETMPNRTRALFILTYLTAGRAMEIVRYTRNKENRQSIRKDDLTIENRNARSILLLNIRNEKNKQRFRKIIPVPLDIEENKKLYNLLVDYLNELDNTAELFPFSYKRAYKLLKDATGWNPHWIRHIRLTHLVTVYGYREQQLMMYAGWTDARPSKNYIEMRWEDLIY
jgi:hypothetical protein